MNKLQEAIEWARSEAGNQEKISQWEPDPESVLQPKMVEGAKVISAHIRELITAAERVERARFSSEELVHACHDSYASTPPDVISYRAFAAGFDNGAAWVVQRMKGEE